MRIVLDLQLCQGHGQCELYAPQLFSLDESSGLAVLLVERPEAALHAAARDAASACPVRAITLVED